MKTLKEISLTLTICILCYGSGWFGYKMGYTKGQKVLNQFYISEIDRIIEKYGSSSPSPPGDVAYSTQVASPTFDDLLDAIEFVESGGDSNAVGDNGNAIGAYQIHKIYVDDLNRILKGTLFSYTYEDRWDREKSRGMTSIYITHYGIGIVTPLTQSMLETMARIHNSGPDGWRNDPEWFVRNRGYTKERAEKKIANSKEYWLKVKKVLYGLKEN